jgi:predicted O-methyltransferase YrrM
MWDLGEVDSYHLHTHVLKQGQIRPEDSLGFFLKDLARNPRYKRYLEIGTWNGLGSTKCFYEGFLERPVGSYVFYSLECNAEKSRDAEHYYDHEVEAFLPDIHILHAKAVRNVPEEATLKAQFDSFEPTWHRVDIENMRACPYFFDMGNGQIKSFDVVFLDGGEYTTYYEYLALKDMCSVLVCDDTRVEKSKRIRAELMASPDWRCLRDALDDRNGWCAFERRT